MTARRILHVVGCMEHGGIQTWLMELLRSLDPERYIQEFFATDGVPGAHDAEISSLGSRVLRGSLHRAIRSGRYDVVHSHIYAASGYALAMARWHSVPRRIAHCHTDRQSIEASRSWLRRVKLRTLKAMISRHATLKLATSAAAAADLFGQNWDRDPSVRILHCGVDLEPFETRPDRTAALASVGLPPDAMVIGHVGRFSPGKRQAFLVDVLAEAIRQDNRCHLLLIGDGPLRADVEAHATGLGLASRVRFAGDRRDVPALLSGAVDVFGFPSMHEGLGLAAIEAQAAGVPCLVSDRVPEDVSVVHGLVHRMPLEQSAAAWADRLLAIQSSARPSPSYSLALVQASPFNIARSVDAMSRIYGTVTLTTRSHTRKGLGECQP